MLKSRVAVIWLGYYKTECVQRISAYFEYVKLIQEEHNRICRESPCLPDHYHTSPDDLSANLIMLSDVSCGNSCIVEQLMLTFILMLPSKSYLFKDRIIYSIKIAILCWILQGSFVAKPHQQSLNEMLFLLLWSFPALFPWFALILGTQHNSM